MIDKVLDKAITTLIYQRNAMNQGAQEIEKLQLEKDRIQRQITDWEEALVRIQKYFDEALSKIQELTNSTGQSSNKESELVGTPAEVENEQVGRES